jgi:transcriptional regulator with XRE-family HTH domain
MSSTIDTAFGKLATNQTTRGRQRPIDFDRVIGSRVRKQRNQMGFTQKAFAELIGVTYQQAYKYETGVNRISGGRLYMIARAFGMTVAQLLEGLDQAPLKPTGAQRHVQDLVAAYLSLSPNHQRAVRKLVYALKPANETTPS